MITNKYQINDSVKPVDQDKCYTIIKIELDSELQEIIYTCMSEDSNVILLSEKKLKVCDEESIYAYISKTVKNVSSKWDKTN